MTGLLLSLNDKPLLKVATENLEVLDVSVRGAVDNPEVSYIEVRGGGYAANNCHSHLIWVHEKAMHTNDELLVEFVDVIESPEAGRNASEFFADESLPSSGAGQQGPVESLPDTPCSDSGIPPGGGGQRPQVKFYFRIDASNNSPIDAGSKDGDSHFNFHVLWNWKNPAHVQVVLHSNNEAAIRNLMSGNEHANFIMTVGSKLKFRKWQ